MVKGQETLIDELASQVATLEIQNERLRRDKSIGFWAVVGTVVASFTAGVLLMMVQE